MLTSSELEVALRSSAWALRPDRYTALLTQVSSGRLAASRPAAAGRRSGPTSRGSIAIIRAYGVLTQRDSLLSMLGLGTALSTVSRALRLAMVDDAIDAIVIEVDGPGGEVFGATETASELRTSRTSKPIIGVANSEAASASYWLLASCSEAWVTPGGQVGSIGVWTAHEDMSGALKQAGIDVTLISAGKHKTDANPFQPLGTDARAFLQQRVDEYYSMFTRDVALGRKVSVDHVRTQMGQGRMLGAADALKAKMVDGIGTLEQVLGRVAKQQFVSREATAAILQRLAGG